MGHPLSGGVVHLLEVGGRGGVFQHSLAVAVALHDQGKSVVLHTATDPELADIRITTCLCFDWKRDSGRLRTPRIALHFLLKTVPHVARQHGTIWVQGGFKTLLTLLALLVFRATHFRSTLFSPHNLFARHGSTMEQTLLSLSFRVPTSVVVYNTTDQRTLTRRKVSNELAPLLQYAPRITSAVLSKWKERLGPLGPRVCSAGQLRTDKNLPMLIDAAQRAGTPLVIIGSDSGAGPSIIAAINKHPTSNVELHEGFLPLEDIAAVIALTGLVALPYSVASQSGVAALAHRYGARVLAFSTGGLTEQADLLVNSLDEKDWAEALSAHVGDPVLNPVTEPAPVSEQDARRISHIVGKGL